MIRKIQYYGQPSIQYGTLVFEGGTERSGISKAEYSSVDL